jgi:hypothetical protein
VWLPAAVERAVEALPAGVPELVEHRGDALLRRRVPEPERAERDDVEDLPAPDADEGLAPPSPPAAGPRLPEVGRPDGGPRGPARLPGDDEDPGGLHVGELGEAGRRVADQAVSRPVSCWDAGPREIEIARSRPRSSASRAPRWSLSAPVAGH